MIILRMQTPTFMLSLSNYPRFILVDTIISFWLKQKEQPGDG